MQEREETLQTLRPAGTAAYALLLAALSSGCGDDGAENAGTGTPSTDPLYAMMVQVYDPDDRTVCVSLSDTLDVTSVDLTEAHEFPGVANFAAVDGRLLISSGSEPKVTEFDVTSTGDWLEGRSVSFVGFGLPEDGANFYGQFIVDSQRALLPFGDGRDRLLWNPSEMLIERTLEDSTLVPAESGLTMEPGGNRNAVHYDGDVLQSFYYHDDDWYDFGSLSHIVVYDQKTFAEKRILDVPCPELTNVTRDEKGNTYFSNWGLPTTSLTGEAAPMCVAVVAPDHETVRTIDLREWTGGRVANNFRYVGHGKATANVLHHEYFGVSSAEELSAEVLDDEIWKSGPYWKLWLFDMVAQTGAPIDGVTVPISGWSQFSVVDGRTFLFVPYDDGGRTRAFELQSDGTVAQRFDTQGDVFKWTRVR